jgi:twinkle protein
MSLITPKSLYASVMKMSLDGGLPRGFSTGWNRMDEIWSVRLGEITAITGIPGSGKSEWMDALMVNLAQQHNFHFVIYSPENHPIEFHVSKLLEKITKLPFSDGPTPKMTLEEIEDGLNKMEKHFTFLKPPLDDLSPMSILTLASKALEKIPEDTPTAIVIDPYNELDHRRPSGLTETEYISQMLSQFRHWARDNNIHLFLIAHPTKLQKNQDGTYPVPTLYDIAGSAHFRNKIDNGIVVHRPNIMENPHHCEVYIQKVRFRHVGKPGKIDFRFNPINGTFSDIDQMAAVFNVTYS